MTATWGADEVQYLSSQFNVTVTATKDVTIDEQTGHCALGMSGVIGTIDSNDETQALEFIDQFVGALEGTGFKVDVARTDGTATAPLERA
jgi:hypothetical protein